MDIIEPENVVEMNNDEMDGVSGGGAFQYRQSGWLYGPYWTNPNMIGDPNHDLYGENVLVDIDMNAELLKYRLWRDNTIVGWTFPGSVIFFR